MLCHAGKGNALAAFFDCFGFGQSFKQVAVALESKIYFGFSNKKGNAPQSSLFGCSPGFDVCEYYVNNLCVAPPK
jgi:hypothetical protein